MEHILFVDDEPHILSSLRRLFRSDGFTCHFAASPVEALKILAEQRIAVLVSDHRMPQMMGAEFLARVKEKRPNTVRIMLTGQANLRDVQTAVNSGEIFRFVLKPWDDEELRQTVKAAVDYYRIAEENRRLAKENAEQTAELGRLNANLEEQIRVRTEQLKDALNTARATNTELLHSLGSCTRILAAFIELTSPDLGGHSRRVAEYSVDICRRLKMIDRDIDTVKTAALLHDCGKLGMPAYMLGKSPEDYSSHEWTLYETHPATGADHFGAIRQFEDIRNIIMQHHERFDGSGFPEGLTASRVSLAAYVVGIADWYDHLSNRPGVNLEFVRKRTYQTIADSSNRSFPQKVVQAALEFITNLQVDKVNSSAIRIELDELRPAQRLATNLYTASGTLLAADGVSLTEQSINRIRAVAAVDPIVGAVYVTETPTDTSQTESPTPIA